MKKLLALFGLGLLKDIQPVREVVVTREIIHETARPPELPPYYYTVEAEDYRKTIVELNRQIANEIDARKAAEQSAVDYIITGSEIRKLHYARQVLTNLVQNIM